MVGHEYYWTTKLLNISVYIHKHRCMLSFLLNFICSMCKHFHAYAMNTRHDKKCCVVLSAVNGHIMIAQFSKVFPGHQVPAGA